MERNDQAVVDKAKLEQTADRFKLCIKRAKALLTLIPDAGPETARLHFEMATWLYDTTWEAFTDEMPIDIFDDDAPAISGPALGAWMKRG